MDDNSPKAPAKEKGTRNKNTGQFKPGERNGPGRPKGQKNKITMALREAIEQAFQDLGGVEYLRKLGKNRPELFTQLMAKIIPSEARLAITASYLPVPVQVEVREPMPVAALPAPSSPMVAIVDAEYTAVPATVEPSSAPVSSAVCTDSMQPFDL